MAEPKPLDPLSVLLLQVGELNGKADGIIRQLDTIIADNVLCHADRDNIYSELGKIKTKQGWMLGTATGAGTVLGAIAGAIGMFVRGHGG